MTEIHGGTPKKSADPTVSNAQRQWASHGQ